MAATRDDVLNALARVTDPASGKHVVEAGLVQGLVVRDGNVGFSIEVAPERGQASEPLRKATEDAVRTLPGVLSVTAVLTAHSEPSHARTVYRNPRMQPPQTKPQAQHAHAQHLQPHKPSGIEGVASVNAVASGKCGVGKSTVAVNLALSLSRLGLKVGLLDADIYGPSVSRLLAIAQKPETAEGKRILPIEKYGIKTMSLGFIIREDEAAIWRGPMVQSALMQFLTQVDWAAAGQDEMDVLVLDMPPGTGDAQLTITQRVALTGAVIVSTPQDIALIDARKAIVMFQKVKVPILGIVENMSMFVCENCGHAHPIFGHGGARDTAAALAAPFLGEIPLVPKIRELSDTGTPVAVAEPDGPEAAAFLAVAEKVAAALQTPHRPAPKIVLE
jgi:ATP-binding protein involved in chromosome partitioning